MQYGTSCLSTFKRLLLYKLDNLSLLSVHSLCAPLLITFSRLVVHVTVDLCTQVVH